jgi:hypothetical protein
MNIQGGELNALPGPESHIITSALFENKVCM